MTVLDLRRKKTEAVQVLNFALSKNLQVLIEMKTHTSYADILKEKKAMLTEEIAKRVEAMGLEVDQAKEIHEDQEIDIRSKIDGQFAHVRQKQLTHLVEMDEQKKEMQRRAGEAKPSAVRQLEEQARRLALANRHEEAEQVAERAAVETEKWRTTKVQEIEETTKEQVKKRLDGEFADELRALQVKLGQCLAEANKAEALAIQTAQRRAQVFIDTARTEATRAIVNAAAAFTRARGAIATELRRHVRNRINKEASRLEKEGRTDVAQIVRDLEKNFDAA